MIDIPSRAGLMALAETTNAVAPMETFGFTRSLDDGGVSVLFSYPHGIGGYVLAASDVPEVLRPSGDDVQQADASALDANPLGALEWLLRFGRVERVVSIRIARIEPDRVLGRDSTDREPAEPMRDPC